MSHNGLGHDVAVLDQRLRSFDLSREESCQNGNSFFEAVAKQLTQRNPLSSETHESLRSQCTDYLLENDALGFESSEKWDNFSSSDDPSQDYVDRMARNGERADHFAVQVC